MKRGATLLHLLDTIAYAAFFLDAGGQVLETNPCARALLKRLGILNRSSNPIGTRETTRALGLLLGDTRFDDRGVGELRLASPLARPLICYKRPLGESADYNFASLLIIVDLNACPPPDAGVLRRFFRLTRAEADLAVRIAVGDSLWEAAREQGVAIATARTQLKSVLSKTNTHRQAELVALLNRLSSIPYKLDNAGVDEPMASNFPKDDCLP